MTQDTIKQRLRAARALIDTPAAGCNTGTMTGCRGLSGALPGWRYFFSRLAVVPSQAGQLRSSTAIH